MHKTDRSMRCFFTVLLVGTLFSLTNSASASDNLLSNPGFDEPHSEYATTPPPEWQFFPGAKSTTASWVTVGLESYLSLGTKEYVSAFNSAKIGINNEIDSDTAYLWQGFSATPHLSYSASAYLKSITGILPEYEYLTPGFVLRDGAKAWVSLRWLDGSGNILGTKESDFLEGPSAEWQKFSVVGEAPSGTVSGDILLNVFTPPLRGYTRVAYFDNAALNVVPEPASTVLFGIGGLVLAAARRFRKERR